MVHLETIGEVNEYKYLGQSLKMQDATTEEVLTRIKAGRGVCGRYKEVFCDKNLPVSLKKRVFEQCVIPTITYGCQTWSTTSTKDIGDHTESNLEREMPGITLRDYRYQIKPLEIKQK